MFLQVKCLKEYLKTGDELRIIIARSRDARALRAC